MDMFTKEDLRGLVETHSGPHVSIYMPAHQESDQAHQDSIRLKNLLREADRCLLDNNLGPSERQEFLKPALALLDDIVFWQHQSDGLAVFISSTMFHTYRLPFAFEELVVVAGRFHVKPLLTFLSGDGRFYVLALSQNGIRLLQGVRHSVSEISTENLPDGLAEALKWDDPEKQLQWHTSTGALSGGGRSAVFHGHGTASADEPKNYILRYFRKVDEGIRSLIDDDHSPLVLAGVDYLFPIYKEASTYSHLIDKGIEGNPEALSAEELHERAWVIVEPYFMQARQDAAAAYSQLAGMGSEKASGELKTILQAAFHGRIDTLFVAVGEQQWGDVNPESGTITIHDEPEIGDVDLLDVAAVQTLLAGGTVYAVEPGDVTGEAMAAAIFRY